MKSECIEALIACGHEIEFTYNNKKYSITYYDDKRKKYISVCEFYKEPIDVSNATEVLNLKIDGKCLSEIFSTLSDNDFDIY